ncbi:MAG: PA2169 family four-helix-bundle protein [Sphingobacteriales bacterium]|nr:MAG: PA2169 family four-helix-bundle protein [Sphingobacteriales bacterium]
MPTNDSKVEILNDLIKINNDRIAGYERAINEAKDLDVDLKAMFEGMIRESQDYKQELANEYQNAGGQEVEDGTTNSGKIYRAWMDVKATFTGSDRKAILSSCEFGEDAWRRAYEAALSSEGELDPETRNLITEQYNSEKKSHDLIKKYRDAHDAMDK